MRLVLVDDWASIRETWRMRCLSDPAHEYEIVGEAGDGLEAVACICRTAPDCVLLDLELPGINGFEVIAAVHQFLPRMRFLVISAHCTCWSVWLAMKFQVAGFVDKPCGCSTVFNEALRTIATGGTYYSARFRSVATEIQHSSRVLEQVLSPREMELLALITEAFSDDEIAGRVGLAPSTVKTHRSHILQKLSMPSTLRLMKYAHDVGFTQLHASQLASAGKTRMMAVK